MKTVSLAATAILASSAVSAFLLPLPTQPQQQPQRIPPRLAATNLAAAPTAAATQQHVQETLQQLFPAVKVPSEYLQAVRPPTGPSDPTRSLVRAKAFAAMAPRVLITRGWDIIGEDFTYYSAATGPLDRAEFLGLVAIMERAMPDLRQSASRFEVTKDGAVVYVSEAVGTFTGKLTMGSRVEDGSNLKFQGLAEACVVAFDEEGRLQSLSAGLVVEEESDGQAEGVAAAEQVELMKRLASHQQKLEMTPTGKTAREKIQFDIDATQAKLDAFEKAGETVKVAGGAGLGGLLNALGVDGVPDTAVLGVALEFQGFGDFVEMDELELMSMPTECQDLILKDNGRAGSAGPNEW